MTAAMIRESGLVGTESADVGPVVAGDESSSQKVKS